MTIIDDNFKKNVGSRLKDLRKRYNLTINELVEVFHGKNIVIDEKTIRRQEHGENLPKVETLIFLSELYDVSIDYLIFGEDYTRMF